MTEGGDHDHRRLGVLRAQLAQHLDAVEVGQAEIDQHEVGTDLLGELETLLAGSGHVDFDVFLTEHAGDE